jgi:hypothetical protein
MVRLYMAKKKTDPLDQQMEVTCLKCEGAIKLTIREVLALRGAMPICPNCGEKFDRRKASAKIMAEAEEIYAPLKAAMAELRRERAQKPKKL